MTSVSRLASMFHGTAPVIPFMTAGFPTQPVFLDAAAAVLDAGAGALEIGMPFSDPLADGPAIQQASQQAIGRGVTLGTVFRLAETLRRRSLRPLLLMGYVNPLLRYGFERFARMAADAGVDGTIIPDCPLEEAGEWRRVSQQHGLANVFLMAPTTPAVRLKRIDRASTAFSYCVSVTGVTGARRGLPTSTFEFLTRVRTVARKPFVVGFGISGPDHIRALREYADGFVVGSALVPMLNGGKSRSIARNVGRYIQKLTDAAR